MEKNQSKKPTGVKMGLVDVKSTDGVNQLVGRSILNAIEGEQKPKELQGLTDDQVSVAMDFLKVHATQMGKAHDPVISENNVLELKLMNGGKIKMIPATGFHIMSAKRQMTIAKEAGDPLEMLPYYIMVACCDIYEDDNSEGVPMTMDDLPTRLSARDFNVLESYSRYINLL